MVDIRTEEVAKEAIAALVLQQAQTVARVHPHFCQTHHHPEECYTHPARQLAGLEQVTQLQVYIPDNTYLDISGIMSHQIVLERL
jgi:hypothetical protein